MKKKSYHFEILWRAFSITKVYSPREKTATSLFCTRGRVIIPLQCPEDFLTYLKREIKKKNL